MSSTLSNIQNINIQDFNPSEFAQLDQLAMQYAWNKAQWNTLSVDTDRLWAIFDKEGITSACLCRHAIGDHVVHLLKIMTAPRARRGGQAAELWRHVKEHYKGVEEVSSCYLEVAQTNQIAVDFYHSQGFQQIHQKKSFYSDGSAALILSYPF